jgi:hypothetical protein
MGIIGLLREWKANIVCLQETKMEVITREVVSSLWGCNHVDWSYLGSRGASNVFLVMWDRPVVEKIKECVSKFMVACSFRCVLRILNGHLWVYMVQMMM